MTTSAHIGITDILANLPGDIHLYVIDDIEQDGAYVHVTPLALGHFLTAARYWETSWCMLVSDGIGEVFGPGDTYDEVVANS